MIELEEKCLRNSKIFFMLVMLYIFTSSQEVRAFKLCRKKVMGSKNSENGMFIKSHPIRRDIFIYFCCKIIVLKFQVSKLKIEIEVIELSIWPQMCLFF